MIREFFNRWVLGMTGGMTPISIDELSVETPAQCPFCQYDMEEYEWVSGEWISEDGEDWHETHGVGCPRCECHGPMCETKELAIKAWNV